MFVLYEVQRVDLERKQVGQLFGLFAESNDGQLVFQFGMLVCQYVARSDQIIDAFAFVCDFDRTEEDELLIRRKFQAFAGSHLVMRLEQVDVQRIGDADDLVPCGQRALAGFFLQPMATCDEAQ